jgi:hypothetical protein
MDGGRSGGKYRVDGVYLWALASWDVQVGYTKSRTTCINLFEWLLSLTSKSYSSDYMPLTSQLFLSCAGHSLRITVPAGVLP